MLKRDLYNIIGQTKDDGTMDFGDAAFSTGLMAFCGSEIDLELMPLFIKDHKLVRHPYSTQNTGTAPHNDTRATSRDQVIAFFAGQSTNAHVVNACLNYAKSWKVNSDVLMPANKFFLYKCANVTPPLWLYPLAYFNQALNLLWDCFVAPKLDATSETNQAVCMNIVFGKWWIRFLVRYHPNIYKSIFQYFGGWRKRSEIAQALVRKIESSVLGYFSDSAY